MFPSLFQAAQYFPGMGPKTRVQLAEGSVKFLFHVNPGDVLIGFNQEHNRIDTTTVQRRGWAGRTEGYVISFMVEGVKKELAVTGTQQVLTPRGWLAAKNLQERDQLLWTAVFGITGDGKLMASRAEIIPVEVDRLRVSQEVRMYY